MGGRAGAGRRGRGLGRVVVQKGESLGHADAGGRGGGGGDGGGGREGDACGHDCNGIRVNNRSE